MARTYLQLTGCWQCLPLSVVQLKVKHRRKPHCRNAVVDMFGQYFLCYKQTKLNIYSFGHKHSFDDGLKNKRFMMPAGNFKFKCDRWCCLHTARWRKICNIVWPEAFVIDKVFLALIGQRFSEKDWYYLQTQTNIPFHNSKLIV